MEERDVKMHNDWNNDEFCYNFFIKLFESMGWLQGERLIADLYESIPSTDVQEPSENALDYYIKTRKRVRTLVIDFISKFFRRASYKAGYLYQKDDRPNKEILEYFFINELFELRKSSAVFYLSPSLPEHIEKMSASEEVNFQRVKSILEKLKEGDDVFSQYDLIRDKSLDKNVNVKGKYKNILLSNTFISAVHPRICLKDCSREDLQATLVFNPILEMLGLDYDESFTNHAEKISSCTENLWEINQDFFEWFVYSYLKESCKTFNSSGMIFNKAEKISELYNKIYTVSHDESIGEKHESFVIAYDLFRDFRREVNEMNNELVSFLESLSERTASKLCIKIAHVAQDVLQTFEGLPNKEIINFRELQEQFISRLPYSGYFLSIKPSYYSEYERKKTFERLKELKNAMIQEGVLTLSEYFSKERDTSIYFSKDKWFSRYTDRMRLFFYHFSDDIDRQIDVFFHSFLQSLAIKQSDAPKCKATYEFDTDSVKLSIRDYKSKTNYIPPVELYSMPKEVILKHFYALQYVSYKNRLEGILLNHPNIRAHFLIDSNYVYYSKAFGAKDVMPPAPNQKKYYDLFLVIGFNATIDAQRYIDRVPLKDIEDAFGPFNLTLIKRKRLL